MVIKDKFGNLLVPDQVRGAGFVQGALYINNVQQMHFKPMDVLKRAKDHFDSLPHLRMGTPLTPDEATAIRVMCSMAGL